MAIPCCATNARTGGLLLFTAVVACLVSGCRERASQGSSGSPEGTLAQVLGQIVAQTTALAPEGRPIRLAVATFVPTQREYAERNDFGRFFTEELTSELKKNAAAVRLFERSRLEVITKENALTLSGLINQETAAKIGELAPIDFILTGTYTRLGDDVGINVRLLDVVSGEILFTANLRIASDERLAALFVIQDDRRASDTSARPAEPDDPCAPVNAKLNELMADLSSPEKVSAFVKEAVKVPFDTLCGKIHYRILGRFDRYDIQDPDYTRFLLATLEDVRVPTSDHRGIEILRYFHEHKPLSDDIWNAGLELVRKVGNDYLNVYLGQLFHTRGEISDEYMQTQYRRIDQYLALALDGGIGLPVAVSPTMAFRELIGALGPRFDKTDKRPILYCYERYWDRLPRGAFRLHHKLLGSVYSYESDTARKTHVLDFICRNFNEASVDKELAKSIYDFARSRWNASRDTRSNPEQVALAKRHLARFLEQCRPTLECAIIETGYAKDDKNLVRFCIANDLDIAGVVPTVDSLMVQLFDDNLNAQREAAEFLRLMGAKAKPAEQEVLRLLRRAERMRGLGSTNLLWDLFAILGNVSATDTAAVRLMFVHLDSRRHAVPDSVQAALARIGEPVVPLLRSQLPGKEPHMQIRIIEIYGLMGPEAKRHIPYLRTLRKSSDNGHVRDAIEDAVRKIERGMENE